MSRDLVLARVGRNSLHGCWIDRGQQRNWDLMLVPYQEMPPQDPADCSVSEIIPGPKWAGLRELLNTWDGWRDYDHIWMPDDDIFTSQSTIGSMFDMAAALRLDLFAPAMHETSYYAHFDTMVNRRFGGRRTGFVEIMMPGFSRAALERLLPTLDLTPTGWGWGLDSLWPKLLDYQNIAVLDSVPMIHTRPVGQMRDADLAARVRAESDAIFAEYDCRQVHTTFSAFDANLEPLTLSPEQLLAELVRGSAYLIERDPRLLAWLVDYQRPEAGWPAYPIEGTPGS
ncbi:MAG: hypothetical protein ACJ762_19520 [Solirubrobacteraceae bacterium]